MIQTPLIARVRGAIRDRQLFSRGDTVIVAVSGGADSCALLHILVNLRDLSLRLIVAHLNHCLRGADADEDEHFVARLARDYGLPFVSRRFDVAQFARQERLSLEDAGRRARHAFLEEVRSGQSDAVIALAHHADDQAETVLMRLLRGAGTTGLSGMAYRTGRGLVRPLLEATRSDIEEYLQAHRLEFREDASNLDTEFLRNRIRHELLPLLESYNPAVRQRLNTTATVLAADDALLEELSRQGIEQACQIESDAIGCDITALNKQPHSLRWRMIRQMLTRLTGSLDHFAYAHILAIDRLLNSARPNLTLQLPKAVVARREYSRLVLTQRPTATDHQIELTISGPGTYPLPAGGFLDVAETVAPPALEALPKNRACFDLERNPFPWHVRTFRNGDRMIPLGMRGSKKLKDIFIDDKIPLAKRRGIPLLFSGDTLIWACGVRFSERARLTAGPTRLIAVEYRLQ